MATPGHRSGPTGTCPYSNRREIMSETRAQATHELLLGLNRDTTNVLHGMEILSQQVLALTQTVGPARGMCGSGVAEWIAAGEDPGVPLPAAMTVAVVPGVGTVPVCLEHFREFCTSQKGPQLLLAQPGMPPTDHRGRVVPGR
jgi:multisubunit Na+/H+ antiporter MnhC subunit